MSNELQKDEFILPGNLGTVKVNNKVGAISSVFRKKDGSTTVTIRPILTDEERKEIKDVLIRDIYRTTINKRLQFYEPAKQIAP